MRRLASSEPALMLHSKEPSPGKGGKRARSPFTSFQRRVVKGPAPHAGTHAGSSSAASCSAAPAMQADAPPAVWPKWLQDQMSDLETQTRARGREVPYNATKVEKAIAEFREQNFRCRPAHHPERFLNYVLGRPFVVLEPAKNNELSGMLAKPPQANLSLLS